MQKQILHASQKPEWDNGKRLIPCKVLNVITVNVTEAFWLFQLMQQSSRPMKDTVMSEYFTITTVSPSHTNVIMTNVPFCNYRCGGQFTYQHHCHCM